MNKLAVIMKPLCCHREWNPDVAGADRLMTDVISFKFKHLLINKVYAEDERPSVERLPAIWGNIRVWPKYPLADRGL